MRHCFICKQPMLSKHDSMRMTPSIARRSRLAREWERLCLRAYGTEVTGANALGIWYTKRVWYSDAGGTTKIRPWPEAIGDLKATSARVSRMVSG